MNLLLKLKIIIYFSHLFHFFTKNKQLEKIHLRSFHLKALIFNYIIIIIKFVFKIQEKNRIKQFFIIFYCDFISGIIVLIMIKKGEKKFFF